MFHLLSHFCSTRRSAALLCCLLTGLASGAGATTRIVTKAADTNDGVCDADCSLREAIAGSASNDTINFAFSGTADLKLGELVIGRNLTITGPSRGVTIAGRFVSRVFNILGVTVRLANLSISNGYVVGSAGADFDATNNTPVGDGGMTFGGGIFNKGTLTLTNCTVLGNIAVGGKGGNTNALNIAPGSGGSAFGGGIFNQGTLTLINCTVLDNTAVGGNAGNARNNFGGGGGSGVGGGVANEGTLTFINCTLSDNKALGGNGGNGDEFGGGGGGGDGGGIGEVSGMVSMRNTIIALNSTLGGSGGIGVGGINRPGPPGGAPGIDVLGQVSSQGHNLIGKTDDSSGWIASDLTGTIATPLNPQLLPLADNGGPTPTRALSSGSVAVNAGDDAVLSAPYNLTTDERGLPRKLGAHVDIGAYERDVAQSSTTFIVNTTDDRGDEACGVGDCTLRDALNAANANANANTITFKASLNGIIITTQTDGLSITNPVTIQGPGASTLAISGDAARRVFVVNTSGSVIISGLTVVGGNAAASSLSGNGGGILHSGSGALSLSNCALFANAAANYGGGIYNSGGALNLTGCTFGGGILGNSALFGGGFLNATGAGIATLTACTFSTNSAPNGGGAFNNGSIVNATNCTFTVNSASSGGGGAINTVGNTTLSGCTLSGNTAQNGGGIYSFTDLSGHTTTLRNCTLSGNSTPSKGGAIRNRVGRTVVQNCTLTNNTAPAGSGSGIASYGDSATSTEVNNSLIVGNTNSDVDYDGGTSNSVHSLGHNLIGSGNATGAFNGTGDKTGVTAAQVKLGSLANNGGPTFTHALLVGSLAINAGNSMLTTDQRSYARVGVPDIGAFEFGAKAPNARPHNDKLEPSGTMANKVGQARLFRATYSDADGYANIRYVYLQVKTGSTGVLRVAYDVQNAKLYILGNDGKYQGGFKPGTAVTLSSSAGLFSCQATKVRALNSTTMQVDWVIAAASPLIGSQPVLLYVMDKDGLSDGFDKGATWTISSAP